LLTVTTYAQVSKALGRLVRSLVDSTKLFVRWMDGTCVETPEQKGPNEDEEPVTFTFYWDVASNPAVIKSMLTLNQAIQKAIHGVGRYIEGWRRHASLWKTDKGSVLDKFKARDPPCAEFEEKLAKYTKVGGVSRNWWALLLQLVAVEPRGVQSGRELQAE
jgi:dynein heavy chain